MIRVHIKRKVAQDKEKELKILINQLRAVTTGQQGYIAGETLKRVDEPGESLIVSKWQSVEAWNRWLQSKKRAEIQDKIDQLLGEETQYEIYDYD